MTRCSACGSDNPDDGRFCTECGHPLVSASEPLPIGHQPNESAHDEATQAANGWGPSTGSNGQDVDRQSLPPANPLSIDSSSLVPLAGSGWGLNAGSDSQDLEKDSEPEVEPLAIASENSAPFATSDWGLSVGGSEPEPSKPTSLLASSADSESGSSDSEAAQPWRPSSLDANSSAAAAAAPAIGIAAMDAWKNSGELPDLAAAAPPANANAAVAASSVPVLGVGASWKGEASQPGAPASQPAPAAEPRFPLASAAAPAAGSAWPPSLDTPGREPRVDNRQVTVDAAGHVGEYHDYLIVAILITIFFCQPLGIIGIVLAYLARTKYRDGDISGAIQYSKYAGLCCLILGLLGLLCGGLGVVSALMGIG